MIEYERADDYYARMEAYEDLLDAPAADEERARYEETISNDDTIQ